MTAYERARLVDLLETYMSEILTANNVNIVKNNKYRAGECPYPDYHYGLKAKYHHARIILTDLLRRQEDDIVILR